MRVYPKFNHIINDAILLLYSKAVYKKQYLAIHKYLEMIVEGIRLVEVEVMVVVVVAEVVVAEVVVEMVVVMEAVVEVEVVVE